MHKIKMLVLSLTGQCNFACVYCYAAAHDNRVMTPQTARAAIELAARVGEPFVLQFSGGEPLLAFDTLRQAVLHVEGNRLPALLQIQTNASLLTPATAAFLSRHKVGVGVSLDGRAPVNDRLRRLPDGRGATGRILRGAALLRDMGIAAGVTCVVTGENVGELPGIVDMAYYMGNIRKIGFDLLRGQGRGRTLTAPAGPAVAAAVEETYRRAARLARLTGATLQFAQLERVKTLARGAAVRFGHCHAMNGEAAFVDAAGKIYACASLVGVPAFYLGDVANGIDDGRREQIGARIRREMDFCLACPDFTLCGGGCFARWLGHGRAAPHPGECALKRVSIAWAGQSEADMRRCR